MDSSWILQPAGQAGRNWAVEQGVIFCTKGKLTEQILGLLEQVPRSQDCLEKGLSGLNIRK